MSIEEFLGRLEAVSKTGEGKWVARCPAHPDGNPSLGVAVGTDGRILLHCYAGCTAEAVVSALGLKMRDLMPDDKLKVKGEGEQRKKKCGRKISPKVKPDEIVKPLSEYPKAKRDYGKLVQAYDYQDANGAVVFRVERRVKKDGKKTFIQMHPDPTSRYGWKWGLTKAGVKRVPFRLPRVIAAAKAGKSVIICEGEKDVISIEKRLGVAATCNPGGAGKWESGWGKFFDGARVVCIIADKDAENVETGEIGENGEKITKPFAVGQRHACDVEAKLRADGFKGGIKKIFMPDVGETACKDFTDWAEAVEAGGGKADREAFQEVIKSFRGWPEKWDFGEEEKAGSVSLTDGRNAFGESGRFGRPCPRAPFKERGWYEVDFQLDAMRIGRFAVGKDGIQFEAWQRSRFGDDQGEFVKMESYDEVKCPPSRMMGMALGCLYAFVRDFKIAPAQRTELACSLALAWLRSRGKFFADVDNPMYATSLYFDAEEGVLYSIQSDEFKSLLSTATQVSRKNKVFDFMMALIEDLTLDKEETPRIRPSRQFDRKGDSIYLSCGDSFAYKVTEEKIEKVPNGTDDVLFLRGETLEPFKLLDGGGKNPFAESMLFKYANFGKQTDAMNCLLWTMNVFFCDANKPILLLNGPKGSGKTFLAQGIMQFIGVRSRGQLDYYPEKIDKTDKSMETFWLIVDQKRVSCFDNFDYRIGWADNDMQVAATGGTHNTRELYKTNVLVTMHARSFFMLTSNNAVFASEGGGLPDRIIKIDTVGRPKVAKGPSVILKEALESRDEYMTWIMRTLSAALGDNGAVDANINMRHPEFAENAVRIGRALGREKEAIRALTMAETDKAVLPLVNDVVAREIVAVLMDQEKPGVMTFTSGEMSKKIIGRLCGEEPGENDKRKYSPAKVGNAIKKKFKGDFETLFEVTSRMLHGSELYEFSGLSARGKTVEDSLKGGEVELNGQFLESPIIEEGGVCFSKNGRASPPTSPYARAADDDVSFTRGEEDKEEGGEDEDFVW